ncbi:MAG: phosphatidylglycerophosphatase A [Paraglaciecola sp.]|jgi:phosphatidylglycerophosphatase A
MNFLYKFFATGFGSGYSPFAPGTAGTIVGILMLIPFMYFEATFFDISGDAALGVWLLIATIIFFFIGVKSGNELEGEWGHDAQKIVIDEIVGVWVTMLFFPFNWLTLLLAFILFRGFDIYKPLGIRKMERFGGGWGVMLDDVAAGVYAWIALKVLTLIWPVILSY